MLPAVTSAGLVQPEGHDLAMEVAAELRDVGVVGVEHGDAIGRQ